ncbi:endonuclease/exonuclease/phosphatase family protein [Ensifer adhaerens]|uniref:endonuclease/exonuclease/phosphatase family protein n=1 Tax=Ensifer adhaerens TaxID=106592 RepID=UPI000FDB0F6D|nr:endonuclease/exonuclease/phosphatase family protein [Ensifer adhaerens]MDF8356158.1 endonuclease/exonuclease/phosphatase family protein [Ensifer adhaerens]THA66372.1 endonuclease [Ensifer adhaerens]
MRFVSYNIQYGIGLDGRFDPERIAASIGEVDIIALQEVTRGFHRNGHVDLVTRFEKLFPGHFAAFHAPCDIDIGSAIEDGRAVSRRFQFGNMILSRWPILATRLIPLPRTRTISPMNLQRGATEALIATPDGPLRVYSVHLDHVLPAERIAQIRYLKERLLGYPLEGGAITGAADFGMAEPPHPEDFVVMGDFNMEPETPEYCAMTGSRDTFYGRSLRLENPVDALAHLGRLTPESYSWIHPENPEKRMHLDYCFLSAGLASRLTDAWTDYEAKGSDHLPVGFTLA